MKKLIVIAFAAALSLGLSQEAQAGPTLGVNISAAVAQGLLTKAEQSQLTKQVASIKAYQRSAMKDGRLSAAEKSKLKKMKLQLKKTYLQLTRNKIRR